jgi:class 3 adenylate cyclase
MPNLPSGTVTFVFSDIEGSTRLLKELGDERYAEMLATHRGLVRKTFAAHGGQEIDTQGDAFFYSFTRARSAVAAAVEVQRGHTEHEWPDGARVAVRLGLHTGEPVVGDEGYTGLDVVRAARIAAGGKGGQILLSEATRAIVASDLPAGVGLRELGARQLKDIEQPESLYELVYGDDVAEAAAAGPPAVPAGGEARRLLPWLDQLTGGRLEPARLIEERVMTEIERAFKEKEAARARSRQGTEPPLESQQQRAKPPRPVAGAPKSVADEVAKLRALHDSGALTDEQYQRAVDRLIAGE